MCYTSVHGFCHSVAQDLKATTGVKWGCRLETPESTLEKQGSMSERWASILETMARRVRWVNIWVTTVKSVQGKLENIEGMQG